MTQKKEKDKIKYGTNTIPYQIIKSKRVKTSEIIVDADNITIRTPINKDKTEIQRIILDKASWILKKQKEYRESIPEIIKPRFEQNSTLPYLGRNYPLRILKKQTEDSMEFVNGEFKARLKSSSKKDTKRLVEKLFESWLIKKAQSVFKEKSEEYSKELGLMIEGKVAIKNLKNRWGSITKNSLINLNVNLLKAHEDVIDYIILHEICHLKIKEHSHRYWDLVHKYMPNYQEKIEAWE